MAGFAHDVLVQALREDATLLPAILERLGKGPMPPLIAPLDSALRFARPAEVRPDIAYRVRLGTEGTGGRRPTSGNRSGASREGWVLCEVQNKVDDDKRRRWLLATAVLHDETGRMGDLVVLTASAAVARWARKVVRLRGPTGTLLRLVPVVAHIGLRRAKALLDPSAPELALCAAWAMQHRHGPAAVRIVERAVEVTEHLPPPLREAQWHAIFTLLSDRMLSRLREVTMNPDHIIERPAVRKLRLFLEKRGREEGQLATARESLLTVLSERGLTPTDEERACIDACSDLTQLTLWHRRAVTAPSVAAALAATVPPRRPAATRRPRPSAKVSTTSKARPSATKRPSRGQRTA